MNLQIIRLAHDEIYGIIFPFLAHMLHKKSTSYQRRPGRLSSAQKQAMHDSEFLIISTDSKAIDCIIGRYDQCTVEIGFGMGDHLLNDVKNNPQHLHIGIDLYQAGIARVLRQIVQRGDKNCYIICADASDAIAEWPAKSIDRINIHHPDPWPKKRHHKRRLIQTAFIQQCLNTLKESGVIEIVTDDSDYFTDIKVLLSDRYNTKDILIGSNRQATSKYGHKAISEGREIQAIKLVKNTPR